MGRRDLERATAAGPTMMCMDSPIHAHPRYDKDMRTTIEIDDDLMTNALGATGLSTKKDVVQLALSELVKNYGQRALLDIRTPDSAWDPAFLADLDAHRIWK
jgi:Arc/MetJ family transcription regulator